MKSTMTHQRSDNHVSDTPDLHRGGLTRKLLVWFLAVALAPLIVVSLVSYNTAKESLHTASLESLSMSVHNQVAFIENWFKYRMIDLESQAASQSTTRFLEELYGAFESGNKGLPEFVDSYHWNRIVFEYGEDLQKFQRAYGYYDVFLIDIDGNILYTNSREDDLGTNLITGEYAKTKFASSFVKTLETGQTVFSDLEVYEPSNNVMAGFLSAIIVNDSGDKIGAIAFQFSQSQLKFATGGSDVETDSVQSYIVGYNSASDGPTIRTSFQETDIGDAQLTKFLDRSVNNAQTQLWFSEHGPEGVEDSSQNEIIFEYDNGSEIKVLGVHQNLHIAGVHWGIIAEIPIDVIFSASTHLWRLMIGLLIFTGVLVIVIASVVTRRVVHPIILLSQAAMRVAHGDLDQLIQVDSNDEIGGLAESFNLMISNLTLTMNELENRKNALNEHAIVSITDIGGKITYANAKFCEISGYTKEELIGQTHSLVKSDEHSEELYQELWKTISSGKVWSGEIKNRCKNGSHYWVSATIVPFNDSSGRVSKYVAIRSDITNLKEVETNLEEGNISLSFALEAEQSTADKLEQSAIEFKQLASTDKLTGLPNRGTFIERLEKTMKGALLNDGKYAVLFFDFDRFKVINDSLGHDIGDELLCDIARIFEHQLRSGDTAARFGGDEFVVLLTNLKEWSDAENMSNRLLDAFSLPHTLGGHLVVSTASIGVVTNRHAYKVPGDMIRDADAAMFQAKENGKAQVVIFDQAMHERAIDRLVLESDLRVALKENQFKLVYQPIVGLDSGRLKGFEALIRWEHPERGLISPDEFITIAEDTGMINEMGRWVLWTAASQISQWNQRFGINRKLSMNVNASKRQLLAPDFLKNILECKATHKLNEGELQLEITESVIVDARSNVIPLLHTIREHGIPIVMDDFGTGVSSLSMLHSYPIDVLKIDQSFIRVLDGDRSLLAVVSSIAALADNLGIRTVAEGVESADIVGSLQSIGCTWGQGYFFAKPLSQSDAEAFIINDRQIEHAA